MENFINLVSSDEKKKNTSASIEEEDEEVEEEEEEDDQRMILLKQSQRSPTTNPNCHAMVALDSAEGCIRENSASTRQCKAKLALKHAEEVPANLEPRFPSFVKSMSRSKIGSAFMLVIPLHICNGYLPRKNFAVNLVDENQEEYPVQYLAGARVLSRGWKFFAIAHDLVQGDALVFQLLKPTEMKVYIIRADWVMGIHNSDSVGKQSKLRKQLKTSKENALPLVQQTGKSFRGDSEELDSEAEGTGVSQHTIERAKKLNNFSVAVDGMTIDSEISEDVRIKYYELCSTQNAPLHGSLYEGINTKLAAGVISQTVGIADAIRTSHLSTSRDEFTLWDNKLEAFEKLGMNVGFLRNRIHKLVGFVFESEEGTHYKETIAGRDEVKEQIRTVKAKREELGEVFKRLDYEIVTHEVLVEYYESKFQKVSDYPW